MVSDNKDCNGRCSSNEPSICSFSDSTTTDATAQLVKNPKCQQNNQSISTPKQGKCDKSETTSSGENYIGMKNLAGKCIESHNQSVSRSHTSNLTPSTKQTSEKFQRETRNLLEAMQREKRYSRNTPEKPGCHFLGYNGSCMRPVGHVTSHTPRTFPSPLSRVCFPNMESLPSPNRNLGFPPAYHSYAMSQAFHAGYPLNCNQCLRQKMYYNWRQV